MALIHHTYNGIRIPVHIRRHGSITRKSTLGNQRGLAQPYSCNLQLPDERVAIGRQELDSRHSNARYAQILVRSLESLA